MIFVCGYVLILVYRFLFDVVEAVGVVLLIEGVILVGGVCLVLAFGGILFFGGVCLCLMR